MYIPPDVFLEATPQTTVAELLDAFTKTETQIVDTIVADLEKKPAGVADYSKQWAASKREKAGLLRKRLSEIAFNGDLDAKIGEAESLVKYSWLDGVGEASLYPLIKGATLPGVQTIPTGVKGLAHEQSVLLSNVRNNFVRAGNRAHRQAVAEISGLVVSGAMGSKQAVQAVTDRLNSTGVAAFVDKSGRRWNTRTYVSMCVATTTHRATVAGKIQTFTALGERFVRVSDHEKDCRLCHPWENKILVLEGEVAPPAVATLAHAQAEGLMHPRCRHTVELTIPQDIIDQTIKENTQPTPDPQPSPSPKLTDAEVEARAEKLWGQTRKLIDVSREPEDRIVNRKPSAAIENTMPYKLNPIVDTVRPSGFSDPILPLTQLHRMEMVDPSFKGWVEEKQTKLLLDTQKQDLWIAAPEHVISDILRAKRFKTGYETKRQASSVSKKKYMEERKKYETEIMGVPEDVKKQERPVSGYVGETPSIRVAQQYGVFQFKMKPQVKGRATVTFGDSLDGQLRPIEMSKLHEANADQVVLARAHVFSFTREWVDVVKLKNDIVKFDDPGLMDKHDHDRALGMYKKLTTGDDTSFGYNETQIHGGVSMDDVEEIVVIKPHEDNIKNIYDGTGWDFDWDTVLQGVENLRNNGYHVRIVEEGSWREVA